MEVRADGSVTAGDSHRRGGVVYDDYADEDEEREAELARYHAEYAEREARERLEAEDRARQQLQGDHLFDEEEGDPLAAHIGGRYASNALIKAPIHTCVIKFYPGLKEFRSMVAPRYSKEQLQIHPYSQPPTIQFFSDQGEHLGEFRIKKTTTSAQIQEVLGYRGLPVPREDEGEGRTFPKAACEDEEEESSGSYAGGGGGSGGAQ